MGSKAGSAEMETVMEKAKGFGVVLGQQGVVRVMKASGQMGVREGTTGRIVPLMLPRVWAVAGTAGEVGPQKTGLPAAAREQAEAQRRGPQPVRLEVVARARENGRDMSRDAGRGMSRDMGVEVRFYRKYTEGLLRRYMQMSMEAGRVPSMMGREVLGGRASSYRIHGFDDAVNFRLDVEKCLRQLEGPEQEVLRRVALQEYTQAEAAVLMGICLRTCVERYGRALDRLTGMLLKARILEPFKMLSMGRA